MRLLAVSRASAVALVCGSFSLQPQARIGAAPGISGVAWLRVDPRTPSTLYVGVAGSFLKRSVDGGAVWQYLPDGTVRGMYAQNCDDAATPPTIARDGHDLYVVYHTSTDPACRNGTSGLLRSRDGALHFETLRDNAFVGLASPVVSRRLYAIFTQPSDNYLDQPSCSGLIHSLDAGAASWRRRGTLSLTGEGNPLSSDTFCPDLIDDPQRPSLLYANTAPPSRSEDGGLTWTTVVTPNVTPALARFALRDDPAAGGLLEGITDGPGMPKDRVFLSADHGRTWSAGTCPGGHAGACPTIVLQGAFGAGARYALYADGIYPFRDGGSTGERLPLGAGWPFTFAQVADMQGGRRPGDPIYAVLKSGALYRSADAGRSWFPLAAGVLPTARPALPPPGSLRAGPYGHAVGRQFVAAYRRLGTAIAGFPVDEPYTLLGMPVQDFEHLRLEWRGGQALVGELGRDSASYIYCGMGSDGDTGPCTNGLVSGGGSASQAHRPDFARFVQHHGGAAVFGTPLTRVYRANNGDGSGRTYDMQLFTRARLEWHPENRNPAYRILLGLIGPEVLRDRHWL